jgi:hypothetical protein
MTASILCVSKSDISESSADDANDEKHSNSDLDMLAYWELIDNNDNKT